MKVWRVVPRVDKLGNQLWSLQYDIVWSDGSRYGLWREDRAFRNEQRAFEDLELVRTPSSAVKAQAFARTAYARR